MLSRSFVFSALLGSLGGLAVVGILWAGGAFEDRHRAPAEPHFEAWDVGGTECITAVMPNRNVAIACDFTRRRAPVPSAEEPMPTFTETETVHDVRAVPLEFEPMDPEAVEIERRQREALLAQRNEMDAQRAAAAERGRLERAFNARPVGDSTVGRLTP